MKPIEEEKTKKYTFDKLKVLKPICGPYIGYSLSDTNDFYLYHIPTKKFYIVPIKLQKQPGCDDLIVGSYYFVIGGYERPKDTYTVSLNSNYEVMKRADLNVGRFYSNSTTINNLYVYTIGGRIITDPLTIGAENYTSSCEKYSFENDTWRKIKPLNIARDCASLGVFNCQYIYAIEGRTRAEFTRRIEILDTNDEDSGWTLLPKTKSYMERVPLGGSWCIQKNIDSFLIAGGTQNFEGNSFDEVWILNAYTGEIEKYTERLPTPAEIYSPAILYKANYYQLIYCYYEPEYNLITYNTVTGRFKITDNPDAILRLSQL